MTLGYNRPLYLLTFDDRESYITAMCHSTPPLTAEQCDAVTDSKQVICDGVREAVAHGLPKVCAGILVDDGFDAAILRDAVPNGCVMARSSETSESEEFKFEYGAAFAEHMRAFMSIFQHQAP